MNHHRCGLQGFDPMQGDECAGCRIATLERQLAEARGQALDRHLRISAALSAYDQNKDADLRIVEMEHALRYADRGELIEWKRELVESKDKLAESQAEVERLQTELSEAESCLWRIAPATHTIGGEPDPFEGHGETYRAAYERLRADGERLDYIEEHWIDALTSADAFVCIDRPLREALDAARATTKETAE